MCACVCFVGAAGVSVVGVCAVDVADARRGRDVHGIVKEFDAVVPFVVVRPNGESELAESFHVLGSRAASHHVSSSCVAEQRSGDRDARAIGGPSVDAGAIGTITRVEGDV